MKKDANDCVTLKLGKKIKLTSDTYIFRFSFTDPEWTFGLPVGNHVVFYQTIPTKTKPEGELIYRKYTPISDVHNEGFVDFVIKVYRKNVHPRFPEGGIMTQYLETLNNGDTIGMQGPAGRLTYQGYGMFTIKGKQIRKTRIGCVAGGSGITPVYSVIQAALKNKDKTESSLIFGNRTVEDILMKEELEQLAENYKDNFKLYLTVDVQPEESANWKQGVGFISKEMIEKQMPPPGEQTIILYCGPPPFEDMMKKHLTELGYTDDMIFKF